MADHVLDADAVADADKDASVQNPSRGADAPTPPPATAECPAPAEAPSPAAETVDQAPADGEPVDVEPADGGPADVEAADAEPLGPERPPALPEAADNEPPGEAGPAASEPTGEPVADAGPPPTEIAAEGEPSAPAEATAAANAPADADTESCTQAPRVEPAALPEAPPYFLGRRRELRQLRSDIDRPGLDVLRGKPPGSCRVLLIAGRPGSGRTTLAARLAHRLAERYPDGQLFARLTDDDGEPVPAERTARELLRELGETAEADDPAAALRRAVENRRLLIVLDDVTHADHVLPLMPAEPGCLVVATSEGPLPGIPDARPCTLGGLDTAASAELLARAVGSTRVTCDPTAVEALAEICEGNPTALRLIAGWLAARPGMSVTDAVLRLREAPEEHVTAGVSPPVARAFHLVHETMARPAARLLRLLARAPARIVDVHIASSLAGCSITDAEGALEDLVRYGLLYPDGDATPRMPQYRLPGWLRPVLARCLEARERPAELRLAHARMLERTVRLLQSCRGTAEPPGSPAHKMAQELPRALRFPSAEAAAHWLRRRLPVLLGAARAAAADGELDTLARRLVAALVRALEAHHGSDTAAPELYELHGLVLDLAERRALPRDKAAALINLAGLDAAAGRARDAMERYRAALDAARAAADGFAAGRALEALGGVYLELGDGLRAADWYGRALALRQTRGELPDEARLHGRLGALHLVAGRYDAALREWRAAAAIHRRLRDLAAYGLALMEISRVQEHAGHPEDALRTCQDALRWARRVADPRLERAVLLRMAETLERLGDPAGAELQRGAAQRLQGAEQARTA